MVHLPPRNSRSPVRVHLRSLGARRIGAFRRRRRRVIPARPTTASSESRVRRLATLLTLILVAAACRASAAEHKLFAWRVAGDPGTVYLLGSIHVGKPDLYPLPQPIEQAFAFRPNSSRKSTRAAATSRCCSSRSCSAASIPAATSSRTIYRRRRGRRSCRPGAPAIRPGWRRPPPAPCASTPKCSR